MRELDEILNRYANNEKTTGSFSEYSLEGITALLTALGRPDRGLSIIHVAGTNGKGSTCHMIESIYRAHGYRTGLYTSPHLERVNERIRFNGEEIADDAFLAAVAETDRCARAIDSAQMTYFDILTASALLHFRNMKTEIVILETGMGGRLDSTNAILPRTVVLTPVDYDHTHILGNSLTEIAAEKAEIIKNGIPVITTNRNADVIEVIARKAQFMRAPLSSIDDDFRADNIRSNDDTVSFSFRNRSVTYENIAIRHPGIFQCENAAAAIQCAFAAGLEPEEPLIRRSFDALRIPGRMETLCAEPRVIFDPAHNEQALVSLSETIKSANAGPGIIACVTLMRDKKPERMIELIREHITGEIYYLTIDDPRSFVPEDSGSFSGVLPASDGTIRALAGIPSDGKIFLFTGSFRIYHFASRLARFFVDRNGFSSSSEDSR